MSKKFYAVNRETGERWKPDPDVVAARERGNTDVNQYLIMFDSGYLGVVSRYADGWETSVNPLDPKKWRTIVTLDTEWIEKRQPDLVME